MKFSLAQISLSFIDADFTVLFLGWFSLVSTKKRNLYYQFHWAIKCFIYNKEEIQEMKIAYVGFIEKKAFFFVNLFLNFYAFSMWNPNLSKK